MTEIKSKILDYLRLKCPNFKCGSGEHPTFTCPSCGLDGVASLLKEDTEVYCPDCGDVGDIFRVAPLIDPDAPTAEALEIYISELLDVHVVTNPELDKFFNLYKSLEFDLVAIQANGKAPFELEWPDKVHKDINEWREWLATGFNIGIKTGKSSKVFVVDIDGDIPPQFRKYFEDYKGLWQRTRNGRHYFFIYDEDIPKSAFDYEWEEKGVKHRTHIDCENNRGQVVAYPSKVEGHLREMFHTGDIPTLSKEFKDFILSNVSKKIKVDEIPEDLATFVPDISGFDLNTINQGNRNNFLLHFGGILRKELNLDNTKYVMDLVNKKFINPSLDPYELRTIVNSLDKYVRFEEKDLALKILNYLKIVGEATSRDVKEVVQETKEKVDKSLSFLAKEGYILKGKRGIYKAINRVEWTETLSLNENRVPFKVPFFEEVAYFNWGDIVLVASKSKWGKTTIAMNMVRDLVRQNNDKNNTAYGLCKPHYISLETGSRFQKTAINLGLVQGDMKWGFVAKPTSIELEKNAVTIIDWLLIEDKSETDIVMQHFSEQLYKNGGFLFIFMQLKEDGTWFAPNMVKQFPAFAARYIYSVNPQTKKEDGIYGRWIIDAIRESKGHLKTSEVHCKYEWKQKELIVVGQEGI